DEEEDYPFFNKYPSLKEEPIVLVEEESCPVYDTDNEAEESMSVYDTDIDDVIEEEEGSFNNPHCNIPKALPVDREPNTFLGLIVPKANSPCSPVGEGSSASLAFADSQENSSLNLDKDCHEIEELSASEEDQGHHETSDYDN
nr:extra-large GTP-binding protein 2 [Tanacetum cinerariifolium]